MSLFLFTYGVIVCSCYVVVGVFVSSNELHCFCVVLWVYVI